MTQKPKISKQKALELILLEIEKGSTFTQSFEVILRNFKLSEPTFSKYWKEANASYQERQKAINETTAAIYTEKNIKAVEMALNDKTGHAKKLVADVAEIDCQIEELKSVKIGAVKIGADIIATTQGDVTSAKRAIAALLSQKSSILEILAKWYGYNAPEQIQLTEVKPLDFRILPPKKE